ncbi:MAG: hypothetical protein NXI07_01710, partial [bacterium]|nr:hypothetical protein [bacterium]
MMNAWGRFLFIAVVSVFAAIAGAQRSSEHWAEDLDTLADGLLQRHSNFYTKVSVEDFEDA